MPRRARPRYRKNKDEDIRQSRRRGLGGDHTERARAIAGWLRIGRLSPKRVLAAAYLRDPAARMVVEGFNLKPTQSLVELFNYGSYSLENDAYFRFLEETGASETSATDRRFFLWQIFQPRPEAFQIPNYEYEIMKLFAPRKAQRRVLGACLALEMLGPAMPAYFKGWGKRNRDLAQAWIEPAVEVLTAACNGGRVTTREWQDAERSLDRGRELIRAMWRAERARWEARYDPLKKRALKAKKKKAKKAKKARKKPRRARNPRVTGFHESAVSIRIETSDDILYMVTACLRALYRFEPETIFDMQLQDYAGNFGLDLDQLYHTRLLGWLLDPDLP